MKKISKKFIFKSMILSISLSSLFTSLSCDNEKQVNQEQDINLVQNNVDINFYYSSYGVQTFYNMIRLAMLSSKEVIFYHSKNTVEIQNNFNDQEFLNFIQNDRNASNVDKKNSQVYQIGYGFEKEYYNKVYEYALKNKNKKINVWFNSDHIQSSFENFLKLTKLNNVYLHGIEDSNVLGEYLIEKYYTKQDFKNDFFDIKTNTWSKPNLAVNRQTQYFVPIYTNNVTIYWSNKNVSDKFLELHFKNNRAFFQNSNKELKDLLFETKSQSTNKRFSSYWSKITGLNWRHERDKVTKLKELNNKQSMIVLGSGFDNDYEFFLTILKKYSNQYNLFYKGHPGQNKTSSKLKKILDVKNNYFFINKVSQKHDFIDTNQINNFEVLESQIPSEELTTEHTNEVNGLFFDKWFLFDYSSSAVFGIKNNKNEFEDIEGFIDLPNSKSPELFFKETDFYQTKLNSLISKIAAKNITLNIKNSAKNKDEISILDIEFYLPKNSIIANVKLQRLQKVGFNKYSVELSFEYNPKNVSNKKSYFIVIPLTK